LKIKHHNLGGCHTFEYEDCWKTAFQALKENGFFIIRLGKAMGFLKTNASGSCERLPLCSADEKRLLRLRARLLCRCLAAGEVGSEGWCLSREFCSRARKETLPCSHMKHK